MSDYIEVLDETDPGSNLVGDTLIHTDIEIFWLQKNIWSARRRHLEGGREEAVLVDGDQITCKSRVDT